jgi:hypothetical protein
MYLGRESLRHLRHHAWPKSHAFIQRTVKTTFEQRLADGNFIHGTTTVHEARDAAGRTRQENAQGCERGEDGQMHTRLSVNIYDPVTKATFYWQVDNTSPKVVHLMHPQAIVPKKLTPEEMAEQQNRMKLIQSRQPREEMKSEQLGTRSINGVLAEGFRTTRMIPAGEEGNELPIVTFNENWTSHDLGLQVLTITDDPRSGKTTTELQDINLSEPDATLFEPPPGYKIEEQHPNPPGQIEAHP